MDGFEDGNGVSRGANGLFRGLDTSQVAAIQELMQDMSLEERNKFIE